MAATKSHRPAKGPRLGRPKGRFTQHRKLDKLRETLEEHAAGLTLAELALVLRVSQRSVRRYLLELGLVKDLESVPTPQGNAHIWRIKPSERGRTVALRRSQAVGLLSLRKAIEPLRGSALFDELDIAFGEVQRIAERPTKTATRGEVSHDAAIHRRFMFVPGAVRNYGGRGEDIDALFHAVAERRMIAIAPREGATFRFATYGLAFWDGSLLAVGVRVGEHDQDERRGVPFEPHGDAAIEMLSLETMRALTVERPTFRIPDGFDIELLFEGAFGPKVVGPKSRVTVEFDARVAEEIKNRRFHPTQKVAQAADGRVRITLTTPNLAAVRTWVLGFGPMARVIEPAALASETSALLQQTRARYP